MHILSGVSMALIMSPFHPSAASNTYTLRNVSIDLNNTAQNVVGVSAFCGTNIPNSTTRIRLVAKYTPGIQYIHSVTSYDMSISSNRSDWSTLFTGTALLTRRARQYSTAVENVHHFNCDEMVAQLRRNGCSSLIAGE